MCRRKNDCSQLGLDPQKWSHLAPLKIPEQMADQIEIFISAVDYFLSGDRDLCLGSIRQIKSEAITNWYIEHGQMSGRHRKLILNIEPAPTVDIKLRDPVRSPAKLQTQVFQRDGYRCRYCNNKLISQDFLKIFIKKLNSDLFTRGKTNLTTHGIIHLAWPVADHVIPWNKGGRTNLDNLVSSCSVCNYGKAGYTIEEIGLENPINRKFKKDDWVGLTNKLDLLKQMGSQ